MDRVTYYTSIIRSFLLAHNDIYGNWLILAEFELI